MGKRQASIQRHLIGGVLVLLLISASRILGLTLLEFNPDEVWNVWSTVGSFDVMLARVPYDWPPLYFAFVWFWQQWAGMHPVVLRFSSVLIFLLACALMYRVTWRMTRHEGAAWVALLAYAALGYSLFLSTYFRAYVFMLLWMPLTLWAVIAYFEQPRWWRALCVALGMAAMFYTNLTAVVAFALLGLYTLVMYPRRLWLWVPVGLIATLIALPEIIAKLNLVGVRTSGTYGLLPLPDAMLDLFHRFLGPAAAFWALGLVMLVAFHIYRQRRISRVLLVLLVWAFAVPFVVYALDARLGFFTNTYSWWVLTGLALLIGYTAQALPTHGRNVLLGLMAIAMFMPSGDLYLTFDTRPFEATFRQLVPHYQAGDAVLIDPNCQCGSPMEWDYYQRVYFEDGLHITDDVSARRLWYVQRAGENDPATDAAVRAGRIPATFFGPPDLLFHLFIAPPDTNGIRFENGLRFYGASIIDDNNAQPALNPIVKREGSTLRVRLWWSTDVALPADYSVSLRLQHANGDIITQQDGGPQLRHLQANLYDPLPSGTSQWQPETLYIEERTLMLPNPLPSGEYGLAMVVYQWWDDVRLRADAPNRINADNVLMVLPVHIMSW